MRLSTIEALRRIVKKSDQETFCEYWNYYWKPALKICFEEGIDPKFLIMSEEEFNEAYTSSSMELIQNAYKS